MNVRFDVLRLGGHWVVTRSGPDSPRFADLHQAIDAAVEAARKHHAEVGGSASVHVWVGSGEPVEHFRIPVDRAAGPAKS